MLAFLAVALSAFTITNKKVKKKIRRARPVSRTLQNQNRELASAELQT